MGARAFAAAQAMVGARFRVQGRDAAGGLDCVGLVAAAYAAAGREVTAPSGYPLRGWARERIERGLAAAGFVAATGAACVGDVAMIRFPAGQFHLGLRGPDRVIHAHAGLRCVVAVPIDEMWRAAPRFRIAR
ncbi:peptidoglycan endopeptidase [Sphingopyxis sp.]|uniref:peptidoglycan endopeptidase n=1 Tax=Sphingopyxis sp. TaxID=1908224 RepID=UPI003BA952AC